MYGALPRLRSPLSGANAVASGPLTPPPNQVGFRLFIVLFISTNNALKLFYFKACFLSNLLLNCSRMKYLLTLILAVATIFALAKIGATINNNRPNLYDIPVSNFR